METEPWEELRQPVICFPRPLPALDYSIKEDETGFTDYEKVALRNAFRVLKRQMNLHARRIYLDFYTTHEWVLERYRCGYDKFHLKHLNQHTYWLLENFVRLVNEGLDNAVLFHIISTEMATRHRNQRMTEQDITLLAQNLRHYFLEVLNNVKSPSLVSAITKLCQLLIVYQFGENLGFWRSLNEEALLETGIEEITPGRAVEFIEHKEKLRQSIASVEEPKKDDTV